VSEARTETVHGRFGGEGEGGHTHMIWNWKTNELFQFFSNLEPAYGKPVYGGKGIRLEPLTDRLLPADLIEQLKHLPRAAKVEKD